MNKKSVKKTKDKPGTGRRKRTAMDAVALAGPLPLYQQVKSFILENIASGEWPPEARIPSENELIEALGVSKMTINRALRELTDDGALIRVPGLGSFVSTPKPVATLLEVKPIDEEINRRGGVHSSKVHLLRREAASPDLASAFGLPAGAEIFHCVVVHYDRKVAIQLEDRYVNPALAPQFLEQNYELITPSRYLLETALLTEVEHVVEAQLPDASTRQLLKIDSGEACLVLRRKTWANAAVVTIGRFIHPASRFKLGGRFKPDWFRLSNGA